MYKTEDKHPSNSVIEVERWELFLNVRWRESLAPGHWASPGTEIFPKAACIVGGQGSSDGDHVRMWNLSQSWTGVSVNLCLVTKENILFFLEHY